LWEHQDLEPQLSTPISPNIPKSLCPNEKEPQFLAYWGKKPVGLDASLIEAVKSSFFQSIVLRPSDTSFVTARMEQELGIKAMSLADGLDHMKAVL